MLLKHPTHLRRHVAQLPGVGARRGKLVGGGNPGIRLARQDRTDAGHDRAREVHDAGEAVGIAHLPHHHVLLERVHPLPEKTLSSTPVVVTSEWLSPNNTFAHAR